jgi:hypothetical protein
MNPNYAKESASKVYLFSLIQDLAGTSTSEIMMTSDTHSLS